MDLSDGDRSAVLALAITAAFLTFAILTADLHAQGPLDRLIQETSIEHRGEAGNAYNTSLDDYYLENPSLDYSQGGNDCQACFTPNPPPFCYEPGHTCYQQSMPIDSGLVLLMLAAALLGIYKLRKENLNFNI